MTNEASSQHSAAAKVDFGPRAKAAQFKGVIAAAVISGIVAAGSAGSGIIAAGAAGQPATENLHLTSSFVGGVSASACYAFLTLEEMVAQSDLVIVGKVVGSSAPYPHSDMPGASPLYYRDVYVRVSDNVKGTPVAAGSSEGFTLDSALKASELETFRKGAAVITIRTPVDSYNGIGVSTGIGEIEADTEALFFLHLPEELPDKTCYRLLIGEGSIFTQLPEGGYEIFDGQGQRHFTADELVAIATSRTI